MKKFLIECLLAFSAAIVFIAASATFSSCDNPYVSVGKPTVKTADVQLCLDSIVNPFIGSFDEAYELQKELKTNAFIDSVFCSLDKEVLKNVTTVVTKKLHYATKDDIVGEFLGNRQIYENLPPPDNASNAKSSTTITTTEPTSIPGVVKEGTTTVTEAPPTRVVESGNYKDTVIDGKHALIKQLPYDRKTGISNRLCW